MTNYCYQLWLSTHVCRCVLIQYYWNDLYMDMIFKRIKTIVNFGYNFSLFTRYQSVCKLTLFHILFHVFNHIFMQQCYKYHDKLLKYTWWRKNIVQVAYHFSKFFTSFSVYFLIYHKISTFIEWFDICIIYSLEMAEYKKRRRKPKYGKICVINV